MHVARVGLAGGGLVTGLLVAWVFYLVSSGWVHTVAVGLLFVVAGAVMIWWWYPTVEGDRPGVIATVEAAAGQFEDAVQRAAAVAVPVSPLDVAGIRERFEYLRASAQGASDRDALEVCAERAGELARLRAYALPKESLALEARMALATMKEWGVPTDSLSSLQNDVLSVITGPDLPAARAALRTLFEEVDAWDDYVTWYAQEYMPKLNAGFLTLLTASVALALSRFVERDVILGILFGGISGALVSVITRLPKLSVYGELSPALLSIFSRVGTGLAATVVGIGFLTSGFFSITMPQGANAGTDGSSISLTRVVEICGRPREAAKLIPATSGGLVTPTAVAADVPGGKAGEIPSAPASSPASTQNSPSGSASAVRGATVGDKEVNCTTGNLFSLFAVALLFGFSERALPSLEDRVFPGAKPTGKKEGP